MIDVMQQKLLNVSQQKKDCKEQIYSVSTRRQRDLNTRLAIEMFAII